MSDALTTLSRDYTSAEEVFDGLSKLATLRSFAASRRQLPVWLFRGHGDDEWKLHDSVTRGLLNPVIEPFRTIWNEALRFDPSGSDGRPKAPADAPKAVRTMFATNVQKQVVSDVVDFAELAGEIGLLHGAAAVQATTLLNPALPETSSKLVQHWNALTGLAQHHGLYTQLLDWTRNPLVALWFACHHIVKHEDRKGWAAVWGMPTEAVRRVSTVSIYVVLDQDFARSQGGLFTYHRRALHDFEEGGRVPCLSELVGVADEANSSPESPLRPFRLRFPKTLTSELLEHLRFRNITAAHLMPTLGNVAQVVRPRGGR